MEAEDRLIASLGIRVEKYDIKVGGYTLHYVVAGEGKPVLLLHAGSLGWGMWYKNIPELARRFRIYAVDLPGCGGSSNLDVYRMNLVKDYVEVITSFIKLLSLSDLSVVGATLGGWIALQLPNQRDLSLDKLIIIDTPGFSKPTFSDKIISNYLLMNIVSKTILRPKRSNRMVEVFLRNVFDNKRFPFSDEFIDYYYDLMQKMHNLRFISATALAMKRLGESGEKMLARIAIPVLVVWGENDKLLPFKRSKEVMNHLQNKQVKLLSDCGHLPPIERSEQFNRLVIDFLA